MKGQRIVTVNLTGCTSLAEVHSKIREAFGFPHFYGGNWSAFEDLLWSECDADCIEILGENTLPKNLSPSMKIMHEVLVSFQAERTADGAPVEILYIQA